MSGTRLVECSYRTAHFRCIVFGQSEQRFGFIQQRAAIAEDDIMVIRWIVPKNTLGIDIDILAPDVVCYRDISVARCFTVYSCSV